MKYTDDQLKIKVLDALTDNGYYSAKWGEEGGKDAREDKGYYQGRADTLLEIYGVDGFRKSQEAKNAYNEGQSRYYNEGNEDEDE